ncbi:MAG: hypothetical protein JST54_10160 [Deltaproteobacteria bacterium]|nr:hypothetical protein [Deltaproteobacteria bacterium]
MPSRVLRLPAKGVLLVSIDLHGNHEDFAQPGEVTARVLAAVSEPNCPLTFLVHGHDRDPNGWFIEGGNQIEPVIFGAPRANKRYLRLALDARYPGVTALRDGEEIRRLYD